MTTPTSGTGGTGGSGDGGSACSVAKYGQCGGDTYTGCKTCVVSAPSTSSPWFFKRIMLSMRCVLEFLFSTCLVANRVA